MSKPDDGKEIYCGAWCLDIDLAVILSRSSAALLPDIMKSYA